MGRRSRKRREPGAPPRPAGPPTSRGEARNEQIRQSLEPLEPGERPTAVTVGAAVAAIMAAANVAAAVAGADLAPERGDATTFTIVSTALLVVCAVGMWMARYWAVLGFMAVIGLQVTTIALALMLGGIGGWRILPALLFLGAIGWLFLKLIRAVARLQMPERPSRARDV
ncbi:MAG TPA: hypothetical protein VHF89_05160 [Solirubrobacteraceae bacterium]|nr:hypothetical protein [Solirubrobacteraceae bacterium]